MVFSEITVAPLNGPKTSVKKPKRFSQHTMEPCYGPQVL